MTLRPEIFLLILASMAVIILPRIFPFLVIHMVELPQKVVAWLSYIPAAVISALLFSQMLLEEGEMRSLASPHIIAGAAALIMAFTFRSIYITVFAGMMAFALVIHLAA